jgi:phenylacetate-CoA oxygenase PaaI subunit
MSHGELESLSGMPAEAVDGLQQLLWALADTKLLLGYHYGEWTFGTPELEAAVANCSISQAELGHVRLLHGILKKHWNDDPDDLLDTRRPDAFANIAYLDDPITDWTGVVAMNAVVDLAATRVLAALETSSFKPLRMSVGKMLDEERHHAHHGRGWFRTLGRRGGDVAKQLGVAASRAMATAVVWMGPAEDAGDRALVAAGVKSATNQDTLAGLSSDVGALAKDAGVTLPPVMVASYRGWNPRTRRAGSRGPTEDIVFHLRGSANAMFRLGE